MVIIHAKPKSDCPAFYALVFNCLPACKPTPGFLCGGMNLHVIVSCRGFATGGRSSNPRIAVPVENGKRVPVGNKLHLTVAAFFSSDVYRARFPSRPMVNPASMIREATSPFKLDSGFAQHPCDHFFCSHSGGCGVERERQLGPSTSPGLPGLEALMV